MVLASVELVKVTLGGKNPLLVAYTSNFADALGVVVPIPVWANNPTEIKLIKTKSTCFIKII
jgi:hypothetical protein